MDTTTLLPGNILYSGPVEDKEAQIHKSLGSFIIEKIRSYGDEPLLIDGITHKAYTAKFLLDSITTLTNGLKSLNLKHGDVVGLCAENCFEFALTMYACMALNVTVAPLNTSYTERELHHAINLSRPKVVFSSSITIERLAKIAKRNSFVQSVVVFGPSSSSDVIPFAQLLKEKYAGSYFDVAPANVREDVALIVCSSGTTGMPKGVQLTQLNIMVVLDSQKDQMDVQGVHLLTVIPWFHAFGCITLITVTAKGASLVYLNKFEEKVFLGAIQKYRVFGAFMVPPLMVFLAKHPIVDEYDLSSLMLLLCGAAPLSKETEDQIKKRIGVPIIRQGYGLSETTLGVLVQTDDLCKPGSVGGLRKGLYAKVVDPDTGAVLGPNQRGELCFKGDFIMKGYIGDVHATQSMVRDGWLHTGDIGYYDKDFEFFIVDRIKELIKYKAFQVPPAEIEALLLTNPKIKDAAVIGKPDEIAGELPMAFVVKQPGAQLSEEEVKKYVADRASGAKKLRGGVVFVKEIPKNPSGKILRRVLRDSLKNDAKSKL